MTEGVRIVRLRDGRRLAFDEHGAPDAPTLIFLHGMPGSRRQVPATIRRLAEPLRMILPDRPGYGASDSHRAGDLRARVDDFLELADALSLRSFYIGGISLGCFYAAAVAAADPDRVNGLFLLSPFALPDEPEVRDGLLPPVEAVYDRALADPAGLESDWRSRGLTPLAALGAVVEEMPEVDRALLADPRVADSLGMSSPERTDDGLDGVIDDLCLCRAGWDRPLEIIEAPAVIWRGAADRNATRGMARYFVGRIRRAELIQDPGGGHLMAFDPDRSMPEPLVRMVAGCARDGKADT